MAEPIIPVEAPARSARKGGIFDVAEVRGGMDRLALGGTIQFSSTGCMLPVGDVQLCYPDTGTPAPEKVREGIDRLGAAGPIFGLYAGVECFLNGSDYESDARSLLEAGEGRGIESALSTWIQELTPVAVTGFAEAVAVLDNEADTNYVGLPVLVMNRGDAVRAYAADALDRENGRLWTPNGTPVLSSSSIPAGSMGVTGGLTVLESDMFVQRSRYVPTNREMAIAERAYAILVDCEYRHLLAVTA